MLLRTRTSMVPGRVTRRGGRGQTQGTCEGTRRKSHLWGLAFLISFGQVAWWMAFNFDLTGGLISCHLPNFRGLGWGQRG